MNINLFGILEEEQDINNDNNLVIQKEKEYMDYINKHIQRVIEAYNKLRHIDFGDDEINRGFLDLGPEIEDHDKSKFSDEEFDYYRIKFYPVSDVEQEDIDELFEKAWDHHYKVNPHHPEHYWNKELGTSEDMPAKYIAEMICDWYSFGDAYKWWNNNPDGREKKSKIMSPHTLRLTEKIIEKIK